MNYGLHDLLRSELQPEAKLVLIHLITRNMVSVPVEVRNMASDCGLLPDEALAGCRALKLNDIGDFTTRISKSSLPVVEDKFRVHSGSPWARMFDAFSPLFEEQRALKEEVEKKNAEIADLKAVMEKRKKPSSTSPKKKSPGTILSASEKAEKEEKAPKKTAKKKAATKRTSALADAPSGGAAA